MSNPLVIIGAPSSAGAYSPGQEKAPDALRASGLASDGGLIDRICAL
jgi:arginase